MAVPSRMYPALGWQGTRASGFGREWHLETGTESSLNNIDAMVRVGRTLSHSIYSITSPGAIVRVAPNEYSFDDPEAAKVIFRTRNQLEK
ncbi:MAG: hypothetical protein Q9183_006218, partial [Haloplaca sp. 2 TL-2023]